jgi:3-hydroxyisobutyrate dehydrogenase-like beta-hydroxyacid dehydrogenase
MRLTVIGMGNMGRAFAGRAVERGHHVTVWNRSPGRAVELVADGAVEADSIAAAVARAEVALMVLADDRAVLEVASGEQGALSSLPAGGVLVNVSTVAPDTVRRLAAGTDRVVLDAPVLGTPEMIRNGSGQFFIGGTSSAVEAVEPLWSDLAAGYTHCGPLGSGATLKLVMNMLLMTGVAAMAEGIATARRHGLSDELLQQVLSESPVVSLASMVRLGSVLDPDHPGWFTPQLARKDVRLANALAEQSGLEPRMGPAAEALLSRVVDSGRDWADFAAVIEAFG